jgi:hypothetical protein
MQHEMQAQLVGDFRFPVKWLFPKYVECFILRVEIPGKANLEKKTLVCIVLVGFGAAAAPVASTLLRFF